MERSAIVASLPAIETTVTLARPHSQGREGTGRRVQLMHLTIKNARGHPWMDFEPWGARDAKEKVMLWTIFVILLVLWLLGFSLHVAGSLIHLLLVVALIVLVFNLISGRRSAS
jgi:hypothetical protein